MSPTGGIAIAARAPDPGARVRRGGNWLRFSRSLPVFAIFFVLLSTVFGTPAVAPAGDPSRKDQDRVVEGPQTVSAGQSDLTPGGQTAVEEIFTGDVGTSDASNTNPPTHSAVINANRLRAMATDFEALPKREIFSCEDLDPGRTFVVGVVYLGGDLICDELHVIEVKENTDVLIISDTPTLRTRGVLFKVGKSSTMHMDVNAIVVEALE
ncbi:unnamed protein product, partial [Scytosiphon promiscuus]